MSFKSANKVTTVLNGTSNKVLNSTNSINVNLSRNILNEQNTKVNIKLKY